MEAEVPSKAASKSPAPAPAAEALAEAPCKAPAPTPPVLVPPPPEAASKAAPDALEALCKAAAVPEVKAPPVPVPVPPKAPAPVEESGKPKGLLVGDENFLFAAGIQEAYPDMDFTGCSALSTQNLTAKEMNPFPAVMKGRVRHMVNPVTIGKQFPPQSFDELVWFLPGLSYAVPKELRTSDRPLYAYRLHHFVFHLLRSCKLLLKGEGSLHVVWPEETCLMSSPCGAAGIELVQLLNLLGCSQQEDAKYSMEEIKAESIRPIVFGEACSEAPEWLQSLQILHFTVDTKPIPVPLTVALQLNPDLELVSIKGASEVPGLEPPAENAPLRAKLIYEATARKPRLKEIYGPRDAQGFDLVKEALAPDPDALLSIPMEAFMMTLEEMPHFSICLKFQVLEDQPVISQAQVDVLDPRLPTRVARPAPPPPPAPNTPPPPKKRSRPKEEEWGEMKFYCPLTKICTPTVEKMREHMEGELYKRFAARDSTWESSEEKRDLIFDLEEAEEAKRPKMDKGKSGKSKGGKGKRDGKSRDGGKGKSDRKGGKSSGGKKGGKSGKSR